MKTPTTLKEAREILEGREIDFGAHAAITWLIREVERLETKHAAADAMLKALQAIEASLTKIGGWWMLREFLNRRDIYNDDLSDNRVILAAVQYAIAAAEKVES